MLFEALEQRILLSADLPVGALITVNSDADTNVRDSQLTLREAILVNNRELAFSALSDSEKALVIGTPDATSRDRIQFKIGAGGVPTIFVGDGGLPFITDPVFLDGTSQPGFDPATNLPTVVIDASGAGTNKIGKFAAGLEITAGDSIVKGLIITGGPQTGIMLRDGDANTITGNLIGGFNAIDLTDLSGGSSNANGIYIFNSANNQIGGTTSAERNVISGNRYSGIVISGGDSTGNKVIGNWIGTDLTGKLDFGNGLQGVLVTTLVNQSDYPTGNFIGGSAQGEGNVISGNDEGVVIVRGERNAIQGNLIGTTADGSARLGNTGDGIQIIDARFSVIGGAGLAGNVISANGRDGINITGGNAAGNRVENNHIGTDKTGLDALGNERDGIFLGEYVIDSRTLPITPPVTGAPLANNIGGPSAQLKNIISGNKRDGVHIEAGSWDNKIEGNYIGLGFDGNEELPNLGDGVRIVNSPNNTVGGTVVQQGGGLFPRNVISANKGYGVHIIGSAATQNRVLGNYIGTDWTGNATRGNGAGVYLDVGAHGNIVGNAPVTVGGTTFDERNIISGNIYGVIIAGDDNQLFGNFIGTDVSGLHALGNVLGGVVILGSSNAIGGDIANTGNVISGNQGFGIRIAPTGTGNKIQGNLIGTDQTGTTRLANAKDGVLIDDASGNTIGGSAPAVKGFVPGNVISGNSGNGVAIVGENAVNNRVQGNLIGLDIFGEVFLGNIESGVRIEGGHDNTIGGTLATGNVISGNNQYGITIVGGSRNRIFGNFIGTDIEASIALANFGGILIQDSFENVVGGLTPEERNVISGNIGWGVNVLGLNAYRNTIRGNLIGTNLDGTIAVSNSEDGVQIALGASRNTIGGVLPGARNVISGNAKSGVRMSGTETIGNTIQGNFIGTGADGIAKIGNEEHGIYIEDAHDNVVGGVSAGSSDTPANTIAFNGASLKQRGHGIVVASGSDNLISRNSIFGNEGRGIDLGNDSFTPNHSGETFGANNFQNYPVATFVTFGPAGKTITWDLNGLANTDYTIEFFSNTNPDPAGFGEGKRFLQSGVVRTDDNGFAEFTFSFALTDTFISATATDPHNNTSEFSKVDTDGDALADAWEDASLAEFPLRAGGIDINEDGTMDLDVDLQFNTAGVETSAYHKDVFVEVDAMAGFNAFGVLVPPTQTMLDTVVRAFRLAPNALVQNPDGTDGITLHAFLDDKAIAVLPFANELRNNDLGYVKLGNFGTADERAQSDWSTTGRAAKAMVYRYALFADSFKTGKESSSGFSSLAITPTGLALGGGDFAVTLGSWIREDSPGNGQAVDTMGGTDQEQAATFMHELGHSLGLQHSGAQRLTGPDGKFGTDDDGSVDDKPNYHSIMNYLWQMPVKWMMDRPGTDSNESGVIGDSLWNLDYSTRNFGDLDEASLLELGGINGNDNGVVEITVDGRIRFVPESGPADFNHNGSIDSGAVSMDINGDGVIGVLKGYEDWSHLRFGFGEITSFGLGAEGTEPPVDESEMTLERLESLDSAGDGPGEFNFSRANLVRVDEAAGVAVVSVVRALGTQGSVSIDYATANGTALAGSDYTATSGTLVFGDGEYIKTFTIPILNDSLGEAGETILLNLSNPTGGAAVGGRSQTSLTIVANDGVGQFQFDTPIVVVNEDQPTATITVVRTGGAVGAASVSYATENALATAGQDYTAASGILNFANGETTKTFTIALRDDALIEGTETIRLRLSSPSGGASLGLVSESAVVIRDVERGAIQFSDPVYQVTEAGATATVTVIRTNGSDGTVSVGYATTNLTATAGADYTGTTGTLTFADGETVKHITIPIANDTVAEPTETLRISLNNPASGAILGARSSADLQIIDDEAPAIQFGAPSFDVNETAGTATIQVVRVGNINEAASIEFTTADGSARAGTDYVPKSGTISFAAGETSKSISIAIINDTLGEGVKTFQLNLRNPAAGTSIGSSGSTTVRIIDDETVNAATFVVTNTNNAGAGSLRQAILDANARGGTDFITFNIDGAGLHTIRPLTVLPVITGAVTIDGYTQAGAHRNTLVSGDDAALMIELDGSAITSSGYGLRVTSSNSIISGFVINRFTEMGLLLDGSGGNLVTGNFIGTDATGTIDLGNRTGITIGASSFNFTSGNSSNNVIGGTALQDRNVISGNNVGIEIASSFQSGDALQSRGNSILGNYIGVAANGNGALGNGTGITVSTAESGANLVPPGNTIGGIQTGAGNTIAFNTSAGVQIGNGGGNAIRGNAIYSNGPSSRPSVAAGLGIDLGRPVNDVGDVDTGRTLSSSGTTLISRAGANLLQNQPVLSSALGAGGVLTIKGRLDSAPSTTFTIDFYANQQVDTSGFDEGQIYLGTASVTTDALGHAEYSIDVAAAIPAGYLITATATDPGNNTSEFSARIEVGDVLGNVYVVNSADDVDDGIADATHTSLREAIHAANNHPGLDSIFFNIPGSGLHTIRLLGDLPPLIEAVTIDGYTQPGAVANTSAVGFNGTPMIEISGGDSSNDGVRTGLNVAGGNSTIRGLIINRVETGLLVQGPGNNRIEGNILGLDSTASRRFTGNATVGIKLTTSSGNYIGGATPRARNLLSDVMLENGANDNFVQGNYIGTRANGSSALVGAPGGGLNIVASSRNLIGGSAPGEGNVISGNGGDGILISGSTTIFGPFTGAAASGNRVLGNFIGVGADGVTALGNTSAGITLLAAATGNIIGGIEPGAGNVIAWNLDSGIWARGASVNGVDIAPGGNAFRGNSIYSNRVDRTFVTGGGIELEGDNYTANMGVTVNDNGDVDDGPNRLQNFPVLSSAMVANGALAINGRLDSIARKTYQIDFYANDRVAQTGYGDGKTYIGTRSVTTDDAGHADFAVTFGGAIPDGQFITATATDSSNNTSEFSARITVGDVLGSVYVVNTVDNDDDGIANAQHTSLREAILAANNHPGHDTITFNIPGTGVHSIFLANPLPTITDEVTIDGYSQAGAHANTLADGDDALLLIDLDGANQAVRNQVGLIIRAGDSTIKGLAIHGFDAGNILIQENGGNAIQGNFLGADAQGNFVQGFGNADVRISGSSDNLIGGTAPAARNLIMSSIAIAGFQGAATDPRAAVYTTSGNLVQGNYIATDRNGLQRSAASNPGIQVSAASNTIIGGLSQEARNVIAGDVRLGASFSPQSPANNALFGNFIGTDRTGSVALGTSRVFVSGVGNIVGGTAAGAGNVIAGGLNLSVTGTFGGGGHLVQGNRIGTDKTGRYSLGARGPGISIESSNNVIGGTVAGAGNVISGFNGAGIQIQGIPNVPASGNMIQGNFIGTQADGTTPLSNTGDGIVVVPVVTNTGAFQPGGVNNTIGGTAAGAGNVIAFNGGNGVNLGFSVATTQTSGTGISILSNSIYSNGKLGIDLGDNGPTANDAGDADAGDNNRQNFPVITSVTNSGSSITVVGTLNSRPSGTYRLEFFDNAAFDLSGFGEGARFIGTTNVTTDAAGNASLSSTFQIVVPTTHIVTATATDAQGNTSEFSGRQPNASVGETANLAVSIADAPDPVVAGQPITYTVSVTNAGPNAATNVLLNVTLPSGLTLHPGSLGAFSQIGASVIGSIGTIASGATATAQIVVVPSVVGTLTSSVKVSSDQQDPDAANNTASVSTTVNAAADLSIRMVSSGGPVSVGGGVAYTIFVTNLGPSPATAVQITDVLPSSLNFGFFSGGQTGIQTGNVLTWNLGTIGVGDSNGVAVSFIAEVAQEGTITNSAQVTSTTPDGVTSNNTASAQILAVPTSDLALTMTPSTPKASVGETISYTLTVRNGGPGNAQGVVLADQLPGNVTFSSASLSAGSFVFADGLVTVDFGDLASGATATAQIFVVPTVAGMVLTNTAQVNSTGTIDPDFVNNQAQADVLALPATIPGRLYGAAFTEADPASVLYTLDPLTGAATRIGAIGFDRISGMDFDPNSGVLYAIGQRPGTETNVLVRIDTATGAGTEIGLTGIDAIGDNHIATDIAFRESDGALFAYLLDRHDLVTIDLATGLATLVGNVSTESGPGDGLAFAANGRLYHAADRTLDRFDPDFGEVLELFDLKPQSPDIGFPLINAMDFEDATGLLFGSLFDASLDVNYLSIIDVRTSDVFLLAPTIAGLDAIAFQSTPVSNQPPVLAPIGALTLSEGNTRSITVTASDPDGSPVTLAASSLPAFASFTDNGNGSGTLTLAPGFADAGTYAGVRIIASDGTASDQETFAIVVDNTNRAPVAHDDGANAVEDGPSIAIDVLANDTDADSPDTKTVSAVVTTGTFGSVSIDAGGSGLHYAVGNAFQNLRAGQTATDSFSYTMIDTAGAASSARVTVTIAGVNDAPQTSLVILNPLVEDSGARLLTQVDLLVHASDVDGPGLTASGLTILSGAGSLVDNGDGTWSYTPATNDDTGVTFSYGVTDGLITVAGSASLDLAPANDAPVAQGQSLTTQEDTAVSGQLVASDIESSVLTFGVVNGLTHGTLILNANGGFTYTPDRDFHGTDSFTYRANDGTFDSNVATVSLTVNAVNDSPVSVADSYATNEDTTLVIAAAGVLDNDSDADGDALSAVLVSGPAHGSLTLNPDGSFTYTPAANYFGSDAFAYRANDGTTGSDVATVSIEVAAINDAPVAVDDSFSADEAITLTVAAPGVVGNDSDVDSVIVNAILASGPAHGTLTFRSDGSFDYTSAAGFSGLDSFAYQIGDGSAVSNIATVNITVRAVDAGNNAPVAVNDSYSVRANHTLTIVAPGVLANDTDADGDKLTIAHLSAATHGTVVAFDDGRFTYTPNTGFIGTDNFTYFITDGVVESAGATVTISVLDQPPVAADDHYSVRANQTLTIASPGLLANDTDADGDALTIAHLSAAAHGTVVTFDDGRFTYTPDTGFIGTDSFTYFVTDGVVESAGATVTISVLDQAPVAADDAYSVHANQTLTIAAPGVLANDTDADGDALTIAHLTAATHGTVVAFDDGRFTYTPETGFIGTDSFTYFVTDGVVESAGATVTISVLDQAPVAVDDSYVVLEDAVLSVPTSTGVLANDSDADGDALTATLVTAPSHGQLVFRPDGSFTYTPDANYSGADSFGYRTGDGIVSSDQVATVSLMVSPVNDAPVANDDEVTTAQNTVLDIDVLANDTDIDSTSLSVTSVTAPAHGTAQVVNGEIRYTPTSGFSGIDTFTYELSDGDETDSAVVTIHILDANQAPVAKDDAYAVDEDATLTIGGIGVLGNDVDPDGDALTALLVSGPQHGTLTLSQTGAFTYTPVANYNGADTFTYTARDPDGATSTAQVNLTVNPVNDAPVFTTTPGTVFVLDAAQAGANRDSVFQVTGNAGQAVTVKFDWTFREATYNNEVGLYRVDDASGRIGNLRPGDEGYAKAALAAGRAQVIFASGKGAGARKELTLDGGGLYAFYLIQDDSSAHLRAANPDNRPGCGPLAFFSLADANPDGYDHLRANVDASGNMKLSWEDQTNGGDQDFDDVVMKATNLKSPAQSAFTYAAQATDVDGDTVSYRLIQGPQGASIDGQSGVLAWKPTQPGLYHFVLRAEDGKGGVADQAFDLEVLRPERVLSVKGTDQNDKIEVTERDGLVRVKINDQVRSYTGVTTIHVEGLGGNDQIWLTGLTVAALVEGGSGNDKIDGSGVISAALELRGDAGNDVIIGGNLADYLVGGDGNDDIRGGAGNDWILGGNGNDLIAGGDGDDVLIGAAGDDSVKGEKGNDILVKGPGTDKLDGGQGSNRTVDYAAFMAGTVPGMPTQPTSMLDWLIVRPAEVSAKSAVSKSGEPGIASIDWHGNQASNGIWAGLNPFQRKQGIASFADPSGMKESAHQSMPQFDLDLRDSMPGWKGVD